MLAHVLELAALLHEEALLITQPVEFFVQVVLLLHEVDLHAASHGGSCRRTATLKAGAR